MIFGYDACNLDNELWVRASKVTCKVSCPDVTGEYTYGIVCPQMQFNSKPPNKTLFRNRVYVEVINWYEIIVGKVGPYGSDHVFL